MLLLLTAMVLTATAVAQNSDNYVVLEAIRPGTIRARVAINKSQFNPSKPGALLPDLLPLQTARGTVGTRSVSITAGPLTAEVNTTTGLLTFSRNDQRAHLTSVLTELSRSFDGGAATVALTLPDRVYGFGEHQNGQLDSRGLAFDMETCTEYSHSHGGEVCLPFVLGVSNQTNAPDYGLLWNMPNFGSVSFGEGQSPPATNQALAIPRSPEAQTWVAYSAQQYDLVVSVPMTAPTVQPEGAANDVLDGYTFATGRAPHIPPSLAGYVHSRNRYSSQKMLLDALQGFINRSIPLSMIVIDYYNWPTNGMGDWRFDPAQWPDPDAMHEQAASHNVSLMVSAWPFTQPGSDTYSHMGQAGLVAINATASPNANGSHPPVYWPDGVCGSPECYLYDPSQEAARAFYWSRMVSGYFSHGIQHFWLDAAEPENMDGFPAGAGFSLGTAQEVGMMFPFWHTQSIFDGLRGIGKGDGEIWMLTRSAWAGMQRHAASLWSGDTHSDFPSLQKSVAAGLNAQASGIGWWTLDIGGYDGGDPSSEVFNRLLVRWFEYGLTLPVFRQHGKRPTEPWELVNETCYTAVVRLIRQRYQLAPYVLHELNKTTEVGTPLQRPLWWDFPRDPKTAGITGEYMFGSGLLAMPVVEDLVTQMDVYLPEGDSWISCSTNATYSGGQTITVAAPLGVLPLFKRASLAKQTNALLEAGRDDPRSNGSPPVCGTTS